MEEDIFDDDIVDEEGKEEFAEEGEPEEDEEDEEDDLEEGDLDEEEDLEEGDLDDEDEDVEIIEVVDGEWEGTEDEDVEIIVVDDEDEAADEDDEDEDEDEDEIKEDFEYFKQDKIYLNLLQELLNKDFTYLIGVIQASRAKFDERFFEIFDYKMEFAAQNDPQLANDLSYLNSVMGNLRVRDNMSPPYEPTSEEMAAIEEEEAVEEETPEEEETAEDEAFPEETPEEEEAVEEEGPPEETPEEEEAVEEEGPPEETPEEEEAVEEEGPPEETPEEEEAVEEEGPPEETPEEEEAVEEEGPPEEVPEKIDKVSEKAISKISDGFEQEVQYLFLIIRLRKVRTIDELVILIQNYKDLIDDNFFCYADELFQFAKKFELNELMADIVYFNKFFSNMSLRDGDLYTSPYSVEEFSVSEEPEKEPEKDYVTKEVVEDKEEKEPSSEKEIEDRAEEKVAGDISPPFEKDLLPDKYKTETLSKVIQGRLLKYTSAVLDDIDMACTPVREHDYIEFKDVYVRRTIDELFPSLKEKEAEEAPPPERERVQLDISRDIVLEELTKTVPFKKEEEIPEEERVEEDYRAILNEYLMASIEKNASNLHLLLEQPPIIRLYGKLKKLDFPVITRDFTSNLVNHILDEKQLRTFLYNKNLDTFYQFISGDRRYSFKVNIYEHMDGWNLNFYFIAPEIPELEDLNLPEILTSFAYMRSGLVIFSGPSRCGKTTTMNSLLKYINQNRPSRIVTVEDPVEYVHSSDWALISQRQIGVHAETLESAVDFAVKEKSDIIVISEVKDAAVMYSAMIAAESGKLVFITMSGSNASTVIRNILDYFSEEKQEQIKEMLAEIVRGIVTQYLIPGMNKDCMVPAVEILIGSRQFCRNFEKKWYCRWWQTSSPVICRGI